jgi:hypothetical protein
MKFDPDKPFQKHRDSKGGSWYIQNGRRFSMAGVDIGPEGSTEKPPKEDKKKSDVRQRAAEKLKDYSGDDESIGPVAEALKENRAAAQAEERAVE